MQADDEAAPEQAVSERLNVFISPEARAMLEEMGRVRFPTLRRTNGVMVDLAIRESYAAWKKREKKEQA
jgi:hypothetical protein